MAFFKSTPNLPGDEKARIEFHLQQIAECIGLERFKLPVVNEAQLLHGANQNEIQTSPEIMIRIGAHLGHDVGGIKLQTFPMQPEKVGGGG